MALAQSSGARIHRRTVVRDAHDPRGLDLLHLRRARRPRAARRAGSSRDDTRCLSRLELTINGERPLLLSSGQGRVLLGRVLPAQPARGRAAAGRALDRRASASSATGCRTRSCVRNESLEPLAFDVGLEVGCRLRGHLRRQGARLRARRPAAREAAAAAGARPLRRATATARARRSTANGGARTQVILSRAGRGRRLARRAIAIELEPRERLELARRRRRLARRRRAAPQAVERRFGEELAHVRDSLAAWQLRVPQLRASWDDARPRVPASRSPTSRRCACAAAATASAHAPGRRDAVVHDGVRPRHADHVPADAALRARARASRRSTRSPSCRRTRTTRRSTPSRARSSTSCAAARRPRPGSRATTARSTRRRSSSCCSPRSGAGRTTPALARELRGARARRARVDRRLGRPRRRRVRRVRAAHASAGSTNQSWKDSRRLAALPRRRARRARRSRRARCRATSTTRSCGIAEIAREVWRDRELADAARARGGRAASSASTRRSGSRSAAASTRSRSTARSGRSTRSARTSGTCSGPGSSRPSASRPSSTS